MILFVATTDPPFAVGGGTSVAELVIEDSEVEEEDVYAVEPDSCEERELWLMVWLNPGPALPAVLVGNTGAVFVLARGP
jgi:hypothetical protein